MRVTPTQDYILVEILDPDYLSKMGLILPEHRKKIFQAKIIDIAPGKKGKDGELLPIDPDMQIGRVGLISRFLGVEYEVDGKKIRWIKADDFLCFLVEKPPTPEQVTRETNSFFVQGRTHDQNSQADCH